MTHAPEHAVLHELAGFAEAIAARARALADDIEVLVLRRDLVSFAIENRNLMPELKSAGYRSGCGRSPEGSWRWLPPPRPRWRTTSPRSRRPSARGSRHV